MQNMMKWLSKLYLKGAWPHFVPCHLGGLDLPVSVLFSPIRMAFNYVTCLAVEIGKSSYYRL